MSFPWMQDKDIHGMEWYNGTIRYINTNKIRKMVGPSWAPGAFPPHHSFHHEAPHSEIAPLYTTLDGTNETGIGLFGKNVV